MYFPEPAIPEQDKRELGDWPIIIPKGRPAEGVWIPDNFQNAILLHIVKNYIPGLNPPLILATQGRKGEGKSFQSREVCSRMGVYIVPISGSLLSGSYEKEAVEILQRAYVYASLVRDKVRRMTVLLIDDFDLSVASTFEGRRYTVNTQLLSGFIMNLADDPTKCGNRRTNRIPIIVTGNDFTSLHSPLIRHGRVNFFDWEPSLEQKKRIVSAIFGPMLLPSRNHSLDSLVEAYANEPISFFASLRDDLVDDIILRTIKERGGINLEVLHHVTSDLFRRKVDVDTLMRLAAMRHRRTAKNYLVPGRVTKR